MDLILLFIPSTAPLDSRSWVQGKIPSRWDRSMRTNFLNGSSRERMAELIHFSRRAFARAGCGEAQAHVNMGYVLLSQRQWPEAESHLAYAARLDPSSKPAADGRIPYKNEIPWEIVRIFERHGFIWGGKWYHYDTMHFEYRPEIIATAK